MQKITIKDEIYPISLKSIPNPPISFYAEGNINLLNSKSIAIIGSRNASENGKKLAEKFAIELSSVGITVVSGLAKGIDTVAHSFSYNQKGKTIAVLGSGINNIYPRENIGLCNKILDNGGLVISEYPPNKEKQPNHFVERNRIISGLSVGVIVIEAKYRSGTGVTARIAKKQGKPVLALPHEIWDLHGVGTNRLLKKGAKLVTCTEDVLNNLSLNNFRNAYFELKNLDVFSKVQDKNKFNEQFSDSHKNNIYNIINETPISTNEIAEHTQYSVNEVLSTLFILEVDGYIKKVSGGYVRNES